MLVYFTASNIAFNPICLHVSFFDWDTDFSSVEKRYIEIGKSLCEELDKRYLCLISSI